ncbi:hypothetical protein [Saccharothrix obliqua]|uniref:hypothetical protein n=1 Tax=Saccharothrix obliqua TaxID=2861747 RepID=UPI001C60173C|nr:hypothetical protein [Saccharothrix obliqua]MBW4719795.1 hypothetical protein [Saccharothrix obliqua]
MQTSTRIAFGSDTGAAWVAAVDMVDRAPGRQLLQLHTHISQPGTENDATRAVVADLLHDTGKQPIDTVVNTLFPVHLAARAAGPVELAARYRALYPALRKESPLNGRGTYFGRLVDYPARDGNIDQLNRLINQLRRDHQKGGRPQAIYENTSTVPHPRLEPPIEPDCGEPQGIPVYAPTPDTIPQSFPCLSHLSFQRVSGRLHLTATYRSQYLIERGYGNFLSLGLLQRYVAHHSGLDVGELVVNTSYATVDVAHKTVTSYLNRLTQGTLL